MLCLNNNVRRAQPSKRAFCTAAAAYPSDLFDNPRATKQCSYSSDDDYGTVCTTTNLSRVPQLVVVVVIQHRHATFSKRKLEKESEGLQYNTQLGLLREGNILLGVRRVNDATKKRVELGEAV